MILELQKIKSAAVSTVSPSSSHDGREEQPHIQGVAAARAKRAESSYSKFKVRRSGCEEIPLIQGKRNPSKTVDVTRGHRRADTLNP